MMYSISDRDESLQIEDSFHAIVIVIGLTGDSVSHDRSSIVDPEIPPIRPGRNLSKTGIFRLRRAGKKTSTGTIEKVHMQTSESLVRLPWGLSEMGLVSGNSENEQVINGLKRFYANAQEIQLSEILDAVPEP
jgi:hypothetical protein